MLKEIIDIYEELKKNVYIIDRGNDDPIIIRFNNENFYHLIGLHKINLDIYFPKYMNSKAKRYKHMKKNIEKYDNIIKNQIKDKDSLELRIKSFINIKNLLDGVNTYLYNLSVKTFESMYDGDYGLLKIFENLYCLLGLKLDESNEKYSYVPQSWMASRRINRLVENKPPKFYSKILVIPNNLYFENNCTE